MKKIKDKIVGFEVVIGGTKGGTLLPPPAVHAVPAAPPKAYRRVQANQVLSAKRYVIQPGAHIQDAKIYVIITDMVFPDGSIRPFELFLKSKGEDAEVWANLFSRLVSAFWQEDRPEFPSFVLDEIMGSVDPRGGYWAPGGLWIKSVPYHIGLVIKYHCEGLGIHVGFGPSLKGMPPHSTDGADPSVETPTPVEKNPVMPQEAHKEPMGAKCPKCDQFKLVQKDGCDTCMDCGYSKCG